MRGWAGLIRVPLASAVLEQGPWTSAVAISWPLVAPASFAALLRYTRYAGWSAAAGNPLALPMLMIRIFAIAFNVALAGDRLDARTVVGTLLALTSAPVVALRSRSRSALLAERGQA